MEIIINNNHKCFYDFNECITYGFYSSLYYFDIYNNIKYISFIEHLDYIKQLKYNFIIDDFTIIIIE
jgi:hypothetical protein